MSLNIKNRLIRFFLQSNPPYFRRFRPRSIESVDHVIAQYPDSEIYREKGSQIRLQPPTLNGSKYCQEYSSLVNRIEPDQFILKLENARVWGQDGAVISDDSVLIKDVSRQFGVGSDYSRHALFNEIIIKEPELIHANVAAVTTAGSSVYYHWMLDILPRILLLKEQGIDKNVDFYVLNYSGLPFQKQTLAMMEIAEEQCLIPAKQKQFHIETDTLYVPSLPSHLNEINLRECKLLAKWLSPFSSKSLIGFERIYISRKKAGTRFIVNEAQLLEILEPLGFVSIDMESYSVAEQIKLFQTAHIIVGPHGSAFTNIIFSKPGTRLVDILPETNIVSCFFGIAAQLEIRYFGYISPAVPINNSRKNDSIKIDVNQFRIFMQDAVLN